MGKDFEEKVRLLLLDAPGQQAEQGWGRKFPPYFVTAFWWGFFFTSLSALLILVVILVLSRFEEQTIFKHPIYLTNVEEPPYSRARMKQENILSTMLETSNNVFFVMNKPLNWRSSCSLESVLNQCGDKNVFLMAFHKTTDGLFEKRLRAEYSNLMMLKVDGHQYFKGSMFDGEWRDDGKILQYAQLLTVWQFGGTVVSPDVIVGSKFPSVQSNECLVSEDILSCPIQCSAFVYQLVLTNKAQDCNAKDLVRKSVEEFCGNPVSCPGVRKLQPTCSKPDNGCFLIRVPEEQKPSNQTWNSLAHFCPVTYLTSKFPELHS